MPVATVTHGPLVLITGDLPLHVRGALKRIGAFEGEAGLACLPEQWPRVDGLLKAMGVAVEAIGEPLVPSAPAEVDARPRSAAVSLEGGRIRIQGDMPKPVRSHWMGSERANGHVGMTPLAIEDFLAACQDQHIAVEVSSDIQKLRNAIEDRQDAVDRALACPVDDLPNIDLKTSTLSDEQRRAIAYIEACGGRAFIADAVGGRKTTTGIGWKRYSAARRVVVISQSTVKGNWQEEVAKFDGGPCLVLDGYRPEGTRPPHPMVEWLVTGYDTLFDRDVRRGRRTDTYLGWLDYLRAWKPDLVIVDESHNARGDGSSDRAQAMQQTCQISPHALLLTATPQSNGPMDRYSQLNALQPGWWGNWFEYGIAFCDGKQKTRFAGKKRWQYWDMGGTSNADVLAARQRYVVLARDRKTLGTHIPAERIPIYMDLDPEARKEYDAVQAKYRAFVTKTEEPEGLPDIDVEESSSYRNLSERMKYILKMRQISSHGCVSGTVDFVAGLVAKGQKPVVFAYFVKPLEGLRDGLRARGLRVGYIRGNTPRTERDRVRHDFDAGRLDVIVGQTEAAGAGINLHKTSYTTVTHELTYRPLDVIQTEGRVNRDGQTAPTTFHYYRFGVDTYDDKVLKKLLDKIASNEAVEKGVEDELLKEIEAEFFRRTLKG